MRKLGRLLSAVLLSAVLAGCASSIDYTLAPDYGRAAPGRIAVLPVAIDADRDAGGEAVGRLFRTISFERLREMNYSPMPIDDVDRLLKRQGGAGKTPGDAARLLGADAVLYIKVSEWNRGSLPAYTSLKIEGTYEMYSTDGRVLWSATHSTKESDLGLDDKAREYGVLKAYEPRIERFVEDVLSTLPRREARQKEQEKLYQWLP